MSIANAGIQSAFSRLSVNDRPSRIKGRIAELRRRNSRLVIDSAAISHDSTIVIPPANNVAIDRDAWAVVICTRSFPTSGSLNMTASIIKRPDGVRDQKNDPATTIISSGANQKTLPVIQFESASTIRVIVGRLFPKPTNSSDMRGTTNVVRKITIARQANNRNVG